MDNELFITLTIQDAMDAFSKLIEFDPDLILLDGDMPNLNGYELCTLLRNHHDFQKIPIVILDETPGLVNSRKFRLAEVTDLLCKPFDRIQLISMIQKHLS